MNNHILEFKIKKEVKKSTIFTGILYKVIILLLFFLPIVDSINGFLLRKGYFSISIFYKLFLIVLFFLYFSVKFRKTWLVFLLYLFSSFSIAFLYHSLFIYNEITDFFIDFAWFVKFFLFLSALYFFINSTKISINTIFKLSIWYFIIYSFNIFLGFLGIGFSQYYGNIGGTGFIYAGNELSFALFAIDSIILIYLLHRRLLKYFYFFFFMAIVVSTIKATKTALLSLFILPILFLMVLLFHNSSLFKVKKKLLFILAFHLLLSVFLLPSTVYILLFKIGLIERIQFWIERVDILTLLLSNRNNFASELFTNILNHFSFLNYILGYGVPNIKNFHISEIDPIDIFYSYGILGIINIYGTLIYLFYKILKLKYNSELKLLVASTIPIAMGISFTAGHVVNSGLAAVPFAMLISLPFKVRTIQ